MLDDYHNPAAPFSPSCLIAECTCNHVELRAAFRFPLLAESGMSQLPFKNIATVGGWL